MTLGEFFRECYLPVRLVGCAQATEQAYNIAVGHWARYVGDHVDQESGISAQTLSKFAAAMAKRSSVANANKTMRHIMALLRYAGEIGVLRSNVPKAVKLKEPRRLPEAWTVDEVQRILAETLTVTGVVGSIPAKRWWYSLLLTLYYCGGRVGAVLATVPMDFLIEDRAIILRAEHQKQNADQYLHLPDSVVAAVAAIYDDRRRLVWPWPHHRTTLYEHFRRILRGANVRWGQGRGGLFAKLRKSHASYLAANGGDASSALGHSSPAITRRHYLDPRIVSRDQSKLLPAADLPVNGKDCPTSSRGSAGWLLD